jgi:hypothetical protein
VLAANLALDLVQQFDQIGQCQQIAAIGSEFIEIALGAPDFFLNNPDTYTFKDS